MIRASIGRRKGQSRPDSGREGMLVVPELRVEKVETPERLREIAAVWADLLERSNGSDFFMLPKWLFAWWDICGAERDPYFVAMWEGDALRALFPLCHRRRGMFQVLSFAGMPRCSDRMDVLVEPGYEDRVFALFVDWLYRQNDWDLLSMRSFGPLSDHPERLRQALADAGRRSLIEPETPYYYIPCTDFEGFEDYLNQARSVKRRRDLRRIRRRLDDQYGVAWEIVTGLSAELIDEMAELDKRRSFRGEQGFCFFCRSMSRGFFMAVAARLPADLVRISTARMEGRLVAYNVAFDFDGRLLSYQTAYDQEYQRESLGNHALLELIRWGFEHGYREYDFLAGEEGYKSKWADTLRQARRLHAYRKDWRSDLLYTYHRWVKPVRRRLARLRRLRRIVPEKLRAKIDI